MFIALGSNATSLPGGPAEAVETALQSLPLYGITVLEQSRLYSTPCYPAGAGPDFVNAAARISAPMSARRVLDALHAAEAGQGRERRARWAPRSLDLDLLADGRRILPGEATLRYWMDLPHERQAAEAPAQLILPHPRLQDRAFVLVPLADIAPDWRHPLLGLSVREMLARLPAADLAGVRPL